MKQSQKHWIICYKVNGKIYPCSTHLGCTIIASECVNVYCNKAKLEENFKQAVAYSKREGQAPKDSGHAVWEGWLKPEWRNGKVFISRLNSATCPIKLTKEPHFQTEEYNKGEIVWALRVPCKVLELTH